MPENSSYDLSRRRGSLRIHLEPQWLRPAADAIDQLLIEVSKYCKVRPPVPVELDDQPLPDDAHTLLAAIR